MSMIKDIFSGKYEFDVNRFKEICSTYEIFDKEFLDNVENLITKLDYVDLISMCFEHALSVARNKVKMFIYTLFRRLYENCFFRRAVCG